MYFSESELLSLYVYPRLCVVQWEDHGHATFYPPISTTKGSLDDHGHAAFYPPISTTKGSLDDHGHAAFYPPISTTKGSLDDHGHAAFYPPISTTKGSLYDHYHWLNNDDDRDPYETLIKDVSVSDVSDQMKMTENEPENGENETFSKEEMLRFLRRYLNDPEALAIETEHF